MLIPKNLLAVSLTLTLLGALACAKHPLYSQLGIKDSEAQLSESARFYRQLEQALYGSRAKLEYDLHTPRLMVSDAVLYLPDVAEVNSDAYFLLNQIAKTLADFQNVYMVLRYTDQTAQDAKIKTKLENLQQYFIARRISAQRVHINDPFYSIDGSAAPSVIMIFKSHQELGTR